MSAAAQPSIDRRSFLQVSAAAMAALELSRARRAMGMPLETPAVRP